MIKNLPFTIFMFLSILIIIISSIHLRAQEELPSTDIFVEKVMKYIPTKIEGEPLSNYNFYLLFDQYQLNTKNFINTLSFFEESHYPYQIITIYPYLNPLYLDKLKEVTQISITKGSLNEVLTQFYQVYTTTLRTYKLDLLLETSEVKGIPIRLIKINTSFKAITSFIDKYPLVKYSLYSVLIFKTYPH